MSNPTPFWAAYYKAHPIDPDVTTSCNDTYTPRQPAKGAACKRCEEWNQYQDPDPLFPYMCWSCREWHARMP